MKLFMFTLFLLGSQSKLRGDTQLSLLDMMKSVDPELRPTTKANNQQLSAGYPPISLRDRLLYSFTLGKWDNKAYLPESSLTYLITPKNVRADQANATPDLVDFICTKATRVFVTVLMCLDSETYELDVVPTMSLMQRHGFTDQFLPISRSTFAHFSDSSSSGAAHRIDCSHDAALDVFHDTAFTKASLRQFFHTQWKFLAPIFTEGSQQMQLSDECPLPITNIKLGGVENDSWVYKVQIHPDHQRILPAVQYYSLPHLPIADHQ